MNKMSVLVEINARKTDPEKLILAVKKHPEVWNTLCPEYKLRRCKEVAWSQIASEVVDGWTNIHRSQRNETLRFLIRRWNNIRDYYVKSLKAGRPKKYTFSKLLTFLHPELHRKMQIQHVMSQPEYFKVEALDDEDEDLEDNPTEKVVEEEELQENYVTYVDSFDFDHDYKESKHSTKQDSLQYDVAPEKEEDPDLMFLKSLLPDMKKLADGEKFAFKCAIMHAYMDILRKRNTHDTV